MIAPGQKNSAISGAGIPNSRNARSQVGAGMSLRPMATTLRLVSSHGAAGVVLATAPVASPQAYSRMVRARICFALVCARAEALRGVSSLDLAEKANTFSAPLGAFIQIVVAIFGAFAARIFSVSPSSTIRDASPSAVKLWGPLCPTL